MYDDLYSDKEPVIERALELLPEDLATARYRRIMRATHLNHIRLYLPPNGEKKQYGISRNPRVVVNMNIQLHVKATRVQSEHSS